MGNCLKRATNDDISLLRGNDSVRETSSDQLGPTLDQVSITLSLYYKKCPSQIWPCNYYI